MPWNWGLLSDQSLANQPEEVKQGLQEQATNQFLLNTLFGGGVMAGLNAARAVPEQYQTAVEQRAFDRAVAQARQAATTPIMGEAAGPAMPGEAAPQMMVGQKFNPEQFLTQLPEVIAKAGPRAKTGNVKEFADLFGKTANQYKDGITFSPSGKVIAAAPTAKPELGIQVIPIIENGVITGYRSAPIEGIIESKAAGYFPTLGTGQIPVKTAGGLGVQPAPGYVQSVQEVEAAQTAGRVSQTPIEGLTPSGAKTVFFPTPPALQRGNQPVQPRAGVQPQGTAQPQVSARPQAATGGIGGAMGPTTAQAALNASYEPILKDAYAGYKLAAGRSGTLQSIRNALSNPNFDTNAFTPAKTALTGFLNATGVTGDKAGQFLTNASAFRQGLNTIAAQSVSELPGAISNFELQFAQSRFGTLTDPKAANMYAIDLMEVADKRKQDFYNFVQKNPRADVIDAWQKSQEGQKGIFEDPKLRKYLPSREVASGANKGKTAYNLPSGEWVVFD